MRRSSLSAFCTYCRSIGTSPTGLSSLATCYPPPHNHNDDPTENEVSGMRKNECGMWNAGHEAGGGFTHEGRLSLRVEGGEGGAESIESLLLLGLEELLHLLHVEAQTGLVQVSPRGCRWLVGRLVVSGLRIGRRLAGSGVREECVDNKDRTRQQALLHEKGTLTHTVSVDAFNSFSHALRGESDGSRERTRGQ